MSKDSFLQKAKGQCLDTGALWRMISESSVDAILDGQDSYDTVSNEPGEDRVWTRGSYETFADLVDRIEPKTRVYRCELGGGSFGFLGFEIWVIGGDGPDSALETACEYLDSLYRDDDNPEREVTSDMSGGVEEIELPRVGG